ncbi:hypothetical protein EDB86DRAFT_1098792 [Lactarius hatsudake]|nr:hypothetical protein EDB86DRAFT_1098792 [Lactarius hatsudake]
MRVWDESGAFVLYPTLLGIKVVNTVTNRPLGEGQDCALDGSESVPGRPGQEGHHYSGDGCLSQPHPGRQGSGA